MTQPSWTIRRGEPRDADTIADFNVRLAAETEPFELDRTVVRSGVGKVLEDETKGQYYVADAGGEVVGCLMITHEWSDWRDGDLWWIQSVYTRPDFRGRGVFRSLYEHVVAEARAAGACGIRLYVEHENEPAQATYHKLGMSMQNYHIMETLFER